MKCKLTHCKWGPPVVKVLEECFPAEAIADEM